jgi:hypothetical protein
MYEAPRIAKFTQIKNSHYEELLQMRGCDEELPFNGYKILVWDDKVLEMVIRESCPTRLMVHFKKLKIILFYIFCHHFLKSPLEI